jgi:hypothetical protein
MSLGCALWATSLHQWARRYIRLTQPARCSPEKRALMRAFFANGVENMHFPWVVEGLPMLLHLSLFLFFGGLVIFLFNVDREVFTGVVWWIGLFSIVYGLITLLPLIRHDSPYSTPLSRPTGFLYPRILIAATLAPAPIVLYVGFLFSVATSIPALIIFKILDATGQIPRILKQIKTYRDQIRDLLESVDYKTKLQRLRRVLDGVEKKAEETALKRSSKLNFHIFDWTIRTLGDDDSLEKLFQAIPGLFNSNLVKHVENDFIQTLLKTFWHALNGFMGRTLSSNSVTESVKSRRVIICRDIIDIIPISNFYIHDDLRSHFDQGPVSIARLQAMTRWFTHKDYNIADYARVEVAKSLASMQERDGVWTAFASNMCGLAAQDLRDNIAHGRDNVLLATLIHVSRRAIHYYDPGPVTALTKFDVHHTLPGLQHDFCTLWNELVQGANKRRARKNQVYRFRCLCVVRWILIVYIALHQGTDAAPTAFSPSTDPSDPILWAPSSYPLCDIASHRPDSTAHVPVNSRGVSISTHPDDPLDALHHCSTSGGGTVLRRVSIIVGPPSPSHPTTPNEIGDNSQAPAASAETTLSVHTGPRPADASPPGTVAAAPRDLPPAATLSHPPEGTTQDIGTQWAELEIRENFSIAPTPPPTLTQALVPASESIPPVLNKSLASCAIAATASNLMLPASPFVGFSIPTSPPSRVQPLPNVELLDLLDSTTPTCSTRNATLPRIRARGLVNTGSMCFANAVLQLLVHSPPFWNLFRELGELKGRRVAGDPETGGGATSLVDAMMRFLEEFVSKDKEPPPTQQLVRQAARQKPRDDEEGGKENKVVDSFEPTYMYDAMKRKRKLKHLLVRSRA